MLSRLRNVRRGTGAAIRRREGVVREEVSWSRERHMQWAEDRGGRW